MNKTKRFLLILVCMVLLNINIVYAVGANVALNVIKDEVKPGDILEVKLNVNCEEGVTALAADIEYDKTILALEKGELAEGWTNLGTNEKLEILINESEKNTQLDICKMIFKISENAKEGTTKINITEIAVADIDGNVNEVDKK